jgi:H+/Cl- antiporter ClcA
LVVTAAKLDTLLPYPVLISRGLPNYFKGLGEVKPLVTLQQFLQRCPEFMVYFLANLVAYAFTGLTFSSAGMFLYRHLQTCQSPHFHMIANMRNYMLALSGCLLFTTIFICAPINSLLVPNEVVKREFETLDPSAYARMQNYAIIGISVSFK